MVKPDWRLDVKGDRACVLANRRRAFLGQSNVAGHQLQREIGLRALLLERLVHLQNIVDIRRQIRRRSPNEFKDRGVESFAGHILMRGAEVRKPISTVGPIVRGGLLRTSAISAIGRAALPSLDANVGQRNSEKSAISPQWCGGIDSQKTVGG